MVTMLFAPIYQARAISPAGAAFAGAGAVGAVALIIWGIRHHQKKQEQKQEVQPVIQRQVKTSQKQHKNTKSEENQTTQ